MLRTRKRKLAVSIAAVAMAAAGTFAATNAFAGDVSTQANRTISVSDGAGNYAGSMTHEDADDRFRINDRKADGHGVRGTLSSSTGTVLKSSYNGRGSDDLWGTSFTYNILNGKTYRWKVCTVDGASDTTPVRCKYDTITE